MVKFIVTLEAATEFLLRRNAHLIPHGRNSLLSHLEGTRRILEGWGTDTEIQLAGLFHSVYGTEFFQHRTASPDDRDVVRGLIGARAERIVWTFCRSPRAAVMNLDRQVSEFILSDRETSETLPISDEEAASLLLVAIANQAEPGNNLRRAAQRLRTIRSPSLARQVHRLVTLTQRSPSALLHRAFSSRFDELSGMHHTGRFWAGKHTLVHSTILPSDPWEAARLPCHHAVAYFKGDDGVVRTVRPSSSQLNAHISAGHTVYLHAVRHDKARPLLRAIEDVLGLLPGVSRISAFISTSGTKHRLGPHYDSNNNIVLQFAGRKSWRLWSNPDVPEPTENFVIGQKISEALAAELPPQLELPTQRNPEITIDIGPGDALYVPRGYWHEVTSQAETSVHYNIQLGYASLRELIEFIVSSNPILHQRVFRRDVSDMWQDGQISVAGKQQVVAALETLRGSWDEIGTVDASAFARFVAHRRGCRP